jgi:hypothetical protein
MSEKETLEERIKLASELMDSLDVPDNDRYVMDVHGWTPVKSEEKDAHKDLNKQLKCDAVHRNK